MSATSASVSDRLPVASVGFEDRGRDHRLLLGLGVATYLVYIHYAKIHPLCVGGHGGHSSCETVQSSSYAELDGIPVAVLGLLGYVVILLSLFAPGRSRAYDSGSGSR